MTKGATVEEARELEAREVVEAVVVESPIDKSEWGPGPWQEEPDRVEFEHLGFPCMVRRNPEFGNLCGYVAMPPGHPWHGKACDAIEAQVHGGLTFGRPCDGPAPSVALWWAVGFDAAHAFDLMPGMAAELRKFGNPARDLSFLTGHNTYRDMGYMRAEVESLAQQAAAAVHLLVAPP
jgi:hypothetical protein